MHDAACMVEPYTVSRPYIGLTAKNGCNVGYVWCVGFIGRPIVRVRAAVLVRAESLHVRAFYIQPYIPCTKRVNKGFGVVKPYIKPCTNHTRPVRTLHRGQKPGASAWT